MNWVKKPKKLSKSLVLKIDKYFSINRHKYGCKILHEAVKEFGNFTIYSYWHDEHKKYNW